MDKTYSIILEPAEKGGFVVHVPALPEVCTEGDTEAQAMANARETIEAIIEHRLERGQPIPADDPSNIHHVTVSAGLMRPAALAGYRGHPVYIRGSRHVPPRWETIPDAMTALFDLLEEEAEPFVRAVLGHWMLGFIHPYPDGNGRMARFLMNAMLASGGYPWTVIRVEDRDKYMSALESASLGSDIRPFAKFIAERVEWSIEKAA